MDVQVDTSVSEKHTVSIFKYVSPKRWYVPASPHGVKTQKTNINIFEITSQNQVSREKSSSFEWQNCSSNFLWENVEEDLTPWSRVLIEKLIVAQLVKNSPVFYGTRRFISMLTGVSLSTHMNQLHTYISSSQEYSWAVDPVPAPFSGSNDVITLGIGAALLILPSRPTFKAHLASRLLLNIFARGLL
jgi:hypothetical protein